MNFKTVVIVAFVIVSLNAESQVYSALNFTLISNTDPEPNFNSFGNKYSGCWGWRQINKQKEYAIAGSQSGTYWVDVTNPVTPTVSAYAAGQVSDATWREIKTYKNYCYVISDDGGANSLQIFDMQYLPDSVHKVYDSDALFRRGHTLWIDGTKLYVAGVTYSNNTSSSMNVYSLANPSNPTLLRQLDQDYAFINYVHDMFVRNDTVYASCAYQGLYVFTFDTINNVFTQIGSLSSYAFSGYNHSSALTPNGQTLVFADEVPASLPIKVADVSNLSNIQVLATTNQYSLTTPHNPFVVNNQYCFVSSYAEGIQLYDISNPSAPFLAGYFDTYPQGGGNISDWSAGNYNGNWGAYPYFPSKNILALDMENGIFMLKTSLYENPPVNANFNLPTAICTPSTLTLTNTSTGATSYAWTFAGLTPSATTVDSPSISLSTQGSYSITLFASNPSYSSSVTKTITLGNNPSVSSTNFTNTSCPSCSDGILSLNVAGGNAPYTYTWLPYGSNSSISNNLLADCYTITVNDVNTCQTKTTICISSINTSIASNLLFDNLLIYPNPATNQIIVSHVGTYFNYRLYNQLGQLVLEKSNNQNTVFINLSELPKSIYTIEVETENALLRKKIIVE
jgi:choice-of-anchor B domain-containing protein